MEILFFKEFDRFYLDKLKIENEQLDFLLTEKILICESIQIYYFKFVGMISILDKIIVIFPKYRALPYSEINSENKEYTKLIFQIFNKYQSDSLKESSLVKSDSLHKKEIFNLLSLYEELAINYLEYGLYRREINTIEVNGNGDINWDRTISDIDPFFNSSKAPIYTDFYTQSIDSNQYNYIQEIQKELLTLASYELEKFNELGLHLTQLNFYSDSNSIGSLEYKINLIDIELRETFTDKDLNLLNLMKTILLSLKHSVVEDLSLYGTRNFEKVWEHICQKVLRHDSNWIEKIKKPIWKDSKTDKETEVDTLIPDITFLIKDIFYILDAKYYNCDFNENGKIINSKPGVQDISKQFLYEQSYRDYFNREGRKIEFYNGFLMPSEENDIPFEIIGDIKFPISIFKDSHINLVKLNTNNIYKNYLNNTNIAIEEEILK